MEKQEQNSVPLPRHWYDLWDFNDGNYAYVGTDIDPEQMANYEKSFKRKHRRRREEEGTEYEDRFIAYLRELGHAVFVINRPGQSIDIRSR